MPGSPFAVPSIATNRLKEDLIKAGIYDAFSDIFNSSEIGYAKPSIEIFSFVITRLQLNPNEIIFIDDSESYVSVAKSLGINAFRYFNLSTLRSDLSEILR